MIVARTREGNRHKRKECRHSWHNPRQYLANRHVRAPIDVFWGAAQEVRKGQVRRIYRAIDNEDMLTCDSLSSSKSTFYDHSPLLLF